jgi:hypothetical protein
MCPGECLQAACLVQAGQSGQPRVAQKQMLPSGWKKAAVLVPRPCYVSVVYFTSQLKCQVSSDSLYLLPLNECILGLDLGVSGKEFVGCEWACRSSDFRTLRALEAFPSLPSFSTPDGSLHF